jgi:alpha-galactosidase
MKRKLPLFFIIPFIICSAISCSQGIPFCKAYLHNDTLTLENGKIFQDFRWNNGNLIRLAFGDQALHKSIVDPENEIATANKNVPANLDKGVLKITEQLATGISPAYLKVEVVYTAGKYSVKREFRLYPGCPAIACDLYLKNAKTNSSSTNQIDDKKEQQIPIVEKIHLKGKHWKAESIEFYDNTDHSNHLLQKYDKVIDREEHIRGNLLLLNNSLAGSGLFVLKEAPTSNTQLYYPGHDFMIIQNEIWVDGIGIVASDLNDNDWIKAYGTVIGLASDNEFSLLSSLRQYQHCLRIHQPGRDDMIMMNTWGDANHDTKLNEAFALSEIEAGAKLGISHFQLDDGWQNGISSNSAYQGGSLDNIWRNPDYWKPNSKKFPNGLGPIVKKGKELGVEVCLWFNPSSDNGNENWEKDADALIALYNAYGIRTFKIDGAEMPDKKSEVNLTRMFDKVVSATDGKAVFDLDVTAGRRSGYNFFNKYGNIYLENRYTDNASYYPYLTLRNLWTLSKYIPTQNLQIEFLNIWRNPKKYTGDTLAPVNYTFEYIFAITMMAQPLAWLEATALPDKAFLASSIIKKYKSMQPQIHAGFIFPIGDEPDGVKWTGFQSINVNRGYFLVFREAGNEQKAVLKTWLQSGIKVSLKPVLGPGKAFNATVDYNNGLHFELEKKNSFTLYEYSILK